MQGLNVAVDIYKRAHAADDSVGGAEMSDAIRYANVQARISNPKPSSILAEQGYEAHHIHEIIIYPDRYPDIREQDMVVPISGRWAGSRFRVIAYRPSSLRPGNPRAHIQLTTTRVRYPDDNVAGN